MTVTLAKWLRLMNMNPWHSYQLSNALLPLTSNCNAIVYEYSWQNADRAGRAEIRAAIQNAEEIFYSVTNFSPRPVFRERTIAWPQAGDYRLYNYTSYDTRNHWLGLNLPEGDVRAVGYEHITTPVLGQLTYQDLDGDGVFESATCTVAVPANTTETEIYVTYLSSDMLNDTGLSITPRSVSIAAGQATIVFDTYTLVRPILYTVARPSVLDPSNLPPNVNSPFVQSVNVSRRFCDPTGTTLETAQAVLIWESAPYPDWAIPCSFGVDSPDPAALAYAIARIGVRNEKQGIVYGGEGVYNSVTGTWNGRVDFSKCKPPDRVKIRYYAGRNEEYIDVAIARLAAAIMARRICACESANREISEWQIDYSRLGATTETYAQPMDIDNPFGSRKGQVYAWRVAQQEQRVVGIIAG
jgi:hypothetical protein